MGKLDTIFNNVSNVLNENGLFVFSIENDESASINGGYKLQGSARFGHDINYIRQEAEKVGLKEIISIKEILRYQGGKPVPSVVFIFGKSL